MIGAGFIDPYAFIEELRKAELPGVDFSPAYFRPDFSKSAGETLYGVTIHVTDKRALQPVRLGVAVINTLSSMYPDDFIFTPPKTEGGRYHIDLSVGNGDLRLLPPDTDAIMKKWNADAVRFDRDNEKYKLYE